MLSNDFVDFVDLNLDSNAPSIQDYGLLYDLDKTDKNNYTENNESLLLNRENIINDWNNFQKLEIENLEIFLDLENQLNSKFEELDSLVLLSKESSLENKKINSTPLLNGLFEILDSPKLIPEPQIILKEPIKDCNCQEIIKNLKKQITLLESRKKSNITKEKEEFLQFKESEMENIEKFKVSSLKEIKKEAKEIDKLKKATSILPSKKERTEIENLKKQMNSNQDVFKQKEVRYLLAQDRFKRRIDELTKRNCELLEQVKVLERDRANYLKVKFYCENLRELDKFKL